MKVLLKLMIGFLFALTLTGCFGEDYDVGVPTAHLNIGTFSSQLTEANISWKTASEDVQQTIDDIQELGFSQKEIKVSPEQEVFLDFKENKDNGGDIWTDPDITLALLKDEQKIEIEMDDSREFRFPSNPGNYVLEVEFTNSAGTAQYVGNVLIVTE
jgi:hypothetical protein